TCSIFKFHIQRSTPYLLQTKRMHCEQVWNSELLLYSNFFNYLNRVMVKNGIQRRTLPLLQFQSCSSFSFSFASRMMFTMNRQSHTIGLLQTKCDRYRVMIAIFEMQLLAPCL